MWANLLSEIDDPDVATFAQIDDVHRASVSARLAHAGIPINRDVAEMMVPSDGHFMAVDVDTDSAHDFSRIQIQHECSVIALIGDKEKPTRNGPLCQKKCGSAQNAETQENGFHELLDKQEKKLRNPTTRSIALEKFAYGRRKIIGKNSQKRKARKPDGK